MLDQITIPNTINVFVSVVFIAVILRLLISEILYYCGFKAKGKPNPYTSRASAPAPLPLPPICPACEDGHHYARAEIYEGLIICDCFCHNGRATVARWRG